MSKVHLRELDRALARSGWHIETIHPGNDYSIGGSWEIRRGKTSLIIDFNVDPDTPTCPPIEESYACSVRGKQGSALYFRRANRSRQLWNEELTSFVRSLDE